MRRRTVLASIGVAAAGTLAGCSSGCTPPSTDATADTDDPPDGWQQVGNDARKSGQASPDAAPGADPTLSQWELWEYADGDDERRSHATAPAVANGRAFVATGLPSGWVEDPPGRLYALDPETDGPVWSTAIPDGATGAPTIVGDVVVLGTRGNSLVAFDRESGEEQWSAGIGNTPGTPTVVGDHLYVGDSGGHLNVVDAGADDPGRCRRYSLVPTGARILNDARPALAAPAVADGRAYVVLDTETDGGADRAAALVVLDLESGDVDWRYEDTVDTDPRAPAVGDGTVYVPFEGALHAVDAADGSREWRFATGFDEPSRPAVRDGTVYVSAKNVYALDAATGDEQWRLVNRAGSGLHSPGVPRQDAPAVAGDRVYVGLGALDAADGDPVWGEFGDDEDSAYFGSRLAGGNVAASGPAVADGAMVATIRNGRVVWAA